MGRLLVWSYVLGLAVGVPLECAPTGLEPQWPSYHAHNGLERAADGSLNLQPLNDANAIFEYRGIFHLMMQHGGGNWTHAVSNDLVRWHHLADALGSGGPGIDFPDRNPCDGALSFPDLGAAPFNGSAPVIIYDTDCGTPLPKNQTPPTGPFSRHKIPGDVARLEVARPRDPSSPYLQQWVKTTSGPVSFDGLPCAFPSVVWRAETAGPPRWNMLCAPDGAAAWARYVSDSPSLMRWRLADPQFTEPVALGCYDCVQTGIMFRPLTNPATDGFGPTHIITGNLSGYWDGSGRCRHDAFFLGRYDAQTEKFLVNTTLGPQLLENGCGDGSFPPGRSSWAVAGQTADGRLISVDWLQISPGPARPGEESGRNVASLVRELLYDHAAQQLLLRPVAEYSKLHNASFVTNQSLALAPGRLATLDVPQDKAGALDIHLAFDLSSSSPLSAFGLAIRAPQGSIAGAGLTVSFNVSTPHPGSGIRLVTVYGVHAEVPPVKLLPGEMLQVRALVDRPIIEVFLMGGRAAFVASRVPFEPDLTAIHLFSGQASVIARNVSVYGMGCGWVDQMPTPRQISANS